MYIEINLDQREADTGWFKASRLLEKGNEESIEEFETMDNTELEKISNKEIE